MIKKCIKAIASVLVLSFLVTALPVKALAAPLAAPKAEAVKPEATSPDKAEADKFQAPNATSIIRGALMASSAVWNMTWFQRMVLTLVRTFSSNRASNAVGESWYALGRTVDNLIGTQRLNWPVVQEAVYRTLRDQGFRDVARQGAVGFQEAFKQLVKYFN